MSIEEKLKGLPSSPGVYIMKGVGKEVLYIGKAKNIRARVRGYFRKGSDGRYAVAFLSTKAKDIDFIVTGSEKEALLLEDTLLKQFKPKYNIRLKDSKTYASIKITVQERFPRILVTRLVKKDGARYFGPYVSAGDVRETVRLIRRIFPLCVCSPSVFRNRVRPCLDYQLGICPAPAVGLISEEAYRELALGAVMFLEGRNTLLIEGLRKKMDEASRAQDFEKAAKVRDRMSAIEAMLEKQQVVSHRHVDQDVFALARDGKTMAMQGLFIRDGRLAKTASHLLGDSGFSDDEVVSSFITQYYRGGRFVPDEVVSPVRFESIPLLSEWLASISGKKVSIHAPVRGGKKKLVKM
ncbi:MAG: excinuclease ABC subunit C, partial [Deltaproteobacteria bacterium]|nr:excinuclease ABC subunit C [Deltaproteobacteria bacterium]